MGANVTVKFHLEPEDNTRLANLCGPCDELLRMLEQHCKVIIQNRSFQFSIKGTKIAAQLAEKAIKQLYSETEWNDELTPSSLQLALQVDTFEQNAHKKSTKETDTAHLIHIKRRAVKTRNRHQQEYVEKIRHNDINFAIGPAGTGKTYLAVACAVEALEQNRVRRLILARPAVEAGEHLGFLPGDLSQKVDPYLRPLYDALYEMLGFENVNKLIAGGIIEVAPLAFMRGRTLSDAFIILDESQNTTIEQMKMFLTRIGFGSKAIICGDITQTDLAKHITSGLRHTLEIVKDIPEISFTYFTSADVVRHNLVQKIVEAYEKYA
jgi:phosphate starvation-inducible PhoH-like protein